MSRTKSLFILSLLCSASLVTAQETVTTKLLPSDGQPATNIQNEAHKAGSFQVESQKTQTRYQAAVSPAWKMGITLRHKPNVFVVPGVGTLKSVAAEGQSPQWKVLDQRFGFHKEGEISIAVGETCVLSYRFLVKTKERTIKDETGKFDYSCAASSKRPKLAAAPSQPKKATQKEVAEKPAAEPQPSGLSRFLPSGSAPSASAESQVIDQLRLILRREVAIFRSCIERRVGRTERTGTGYTAGVTNSGRMIYQLTIDKQTVSIKGQDLQADPMLLVCIENTVKNADLDAVTAATAAPIKALLVFDRDCEEVADAQSRCQVKQELYPDNGVAH